MAGVTVQLDLSKLRAIRGGLRQHRRDYVMALALDCERDTKQSFGTSPSPPGNPPGVDTGNLRNNIQAEQLDDQSAAVNVNTDYGIFLEYGTSKMAARPFLLPAVERTAAHANRDGIATKVVTGD